MSVLGERLAHPAQGSFLAAEGVYSVTPRFRGHHGERFHKPLLSTANSGPTGRTRLLWVVNGLGEAIRSLTVAAPIGAPRVLQRVAEPRPLGSGWPPQDR